MFRKIAALLVVVSLGATGAQGSSIFFPARSDFDAGATLGTSHVAPVDVDGDGVTDVVVVALSAGLQDAVNPDLQVGLQVHLQLIAEDLRQHLRNDPFAGINAQPGTVDVLVIDNELAVLYPKIIR